MTEALWLVCMGIGLLFAVANGLLAWAWCRLCAQQGQEQSQPSAEPFTVVITYHNEAPTLPQLLAALSLLDYPAFSVILVNDRSTDDGPALVDAWCSQQPFPVTHLHIDETPPGWTARKWALSQALAQVRSPWVAFTDADCTVPATWLQALAVQLGRGAHMVLGVGNYAPHADDLLHAAVQYDTLHTAWLCLGAAHWRAPYMAVGRSWAVNTQYVPLAAYWEKHKALPSGSDDLPVQQHPHKAHIRACPAAQTQSQPPQSWAEWLGRKARHQGAGRGYTALWASLLSLYYLAPVALLGSLLTAPVGTLSYTALAWGVAWGVQLLSQGQAAKTMSNGLSARDLLAQSLLLYFYRAFALIWYLQKPQAAWQKRRHSKTN